MKILLPGNPQFRPLKFLKISLRLVWFDCHNDSWIYIARSFADLFKLGSEVSESCSCWRWQYVDYFILFYFFFFLPWVCKLQVDAIVNAAKESLLGGGGGMIHLLIFYLYFWVDGAIHHAAGSQLKIECRSIPETRPGVRCPVGEAKLTTACALAPKINCILGVLHLFFNNLGIIHTVGPMGNSENRSELLQRCYESALSIVFEKRLKSVAFCAISIPFVILVWHSGTGVFGFPEEEATKIAVTTIRYCYFQSPLLTSDAGWALLNIGTLWIK